MPSRVVDQTTNSLAGQRIALIGRLASMSKRAAQQLIRSRGGVVVERPAADTTLVILGEHEPRADAALPPDVDPAALAAQQNGTLTVLGESEFWSQLGLVDRTSDDRQLYTLGMLAQLVGQSNATIRRWHRQGWLRPTREVRRLAYFDFAEVTTARRIQELLGAGMTPAAITRTLATLSRQLPQVQRPLAELSVVVEGRQLLVRQEAGLVEPSGQLRFDFESAPTASLAEAADRPTGAAILTLAVAAEPPASAEQLVAMAAELEQQGDLHAAAEVYRAALAAGGPTAELCFLLAELLYQLQDLPAARERYYMSIELDEDYVEARANLGCVLAELGELELAVSAFQGALAFHDDYEDAHYHLARTLDALARGDEAARHWQAFLRLAPASPWADEAHRRLELAGE